MPIIDKANLFLPIRKLYRNAIGMYTSYSYADVIPTTATFFNSAYRSGGESTCAVPFQATDPVPAFQTVPGNLAHIFALERAKQETPLAAAVADYAMKLEWVIEQFWDPSRFHVQLHSGGWDSRIISSIIRKLYQKHGPDWLGGMFFVSAKWEAEQFREIMRREGWAPEQYAVYNADAPEDEYFAAGLEFETAWLQTGGACSFPVNQWWFMIDALQREGRVPDSANVQTIAGLWANETVWCLLEGGRKLADNFGYYYCHTMATLPFKSADVFLPFTHYALLEALPGYGARAYAGDVGGATFRRALAEHVCPELQGISNIGARDPMHPISERLMDRAKADYNRSQFARLRPQAAAGAEPITNFSGWWADWNLASLWEHMANSGYHFVLAG